MVHLLLLLPILFLRFYSTVICVCGFESNHKDPVEVSGYFSLASHPVVGILQQCNMLQKVQAHTHMYIIYVYMCGFESTHKDPVEVWGYSSLASSIFEVFLASAGYSITYCNAPF